MLLFASDSDESEDLPPPLPERTPESFFLATGASQPFISLCVRKRASAAVKDSCSYIVWINDKQAGRLIKQLD